MDISAKTYDELKALREEINDRLRQLEQEAIKTLQQNALRFGFQLVKNGLGLKASLQKPKAVYQNPDNPEETYGGRGRKPAWVEAKLAEGADLEQFRVS